MYIKIVLLAISSFVKLLVSYSSLCVWASDILPEIAYWWSTVWWCPDISRPSLTHNFSIIKLLTCSPICGLVYRWVLVLQNGLIHIVWLLILVPIYLIWTLKLLALFFFQLTLAFSHWVYHGGIVSGSPWWLFQLNEFFLPLPFILKHGFESDLVVDHLIHHICAAIDRLILKWMAYWISWQGRVNCCTIGSSFIKHRWLLWAF